MADDKNPFTINDFTSILDSGAGAAKDLFTAGAQRSTAAGYRAEAGAYGTASTLAEQNADIEKSSTAIQLAQTQRSVLQTVGGQRADTASAGFENSGSALDIMRSSMQQGALQMQLLGEQGQIQQNAYTSQAASYAGQRESATTAADAADASASGSTIGGIIKGVSTVAKVVGTVAKIAKFFF